MDKSTSFLCWAAIFINLHGEIRSQPIYENYKEDCLKTNRTDSFYKEIYDREIVLESYVNTLEKELDICRDAPAKTFTSRYTTSGQDLPLGSRGKGFLVLFMKHYEGTTKNVYVTSEKGVQINITTSNRLNSSLKLQIDMSLNIPSSHHFIFPNGIELKSFKREFKSVFIETSDDVFVVSLDHDDGTADGTTNIPIHKLSTRYVVITIHPTSRKSQLAVAALENTTTISIRFRMKQYKSLDIEGRVYYNGDVFNFFLDRFETYQIAHDTDLTGTFIESSKPVAAFSGSDCGYLGGVGYCDLVMEQLPPTDTIDKTYIVPPNSHGRGTIIRITATDISDIYYVIGTVNRTRLLEKYNFFDIRISSNQTCYIESTEPILVTGFGLYSDSSSLGDPSMTIVPGINQYLNYYKIPIPTGYIHNVVFFMIKESSKAFIRINNAILNAVDIVFEDSLLVGNITYSVVSILVTQGEFKAFTLDGERFGVMVSGIKRAEAYGFSGNSLLP
uniref:IgGFc-binding protein N-terminal domain-containing protein n=1 Tax=Magallana gigas TaxID=29159 RepID=A0A8W8P3W5_MAGGI